MSYKRFKILKKSMSELTKHDYDGTVNGRYFSGGFNWCSEFVSWVYKEAGYPFTDGAYSARIVDPPDNGEWMQRTSTRIVDWFQANSIYVHRDSDLWYDLEPRMGDYVLIGRFGSDRLHSGLVDYVSSSGTLHTIEGNNAGREVMRFQYPHYKINDKNNGEANGIIMGIGVIHDN